MHELTSSDLLYLARRDVERACAEIDPLAVVREVFELHGSGRTTLPEEAYLGWPGARGEPVRSLAMPGYLDGAPRAAGAKIINSNPCNPLAGLPRASGLTLLFDPDSARVRCVMEGAYVSALRTASVSLLSAQLLSPSPSRLGVIGAGAIGLAHIRLALQRLPSLERVTLFDQQRALADAAVRVVAPIAPHVRVEVVDTAEDAVRGADLIVPATTTTTAYIPLDWVRPGAVVVNVSLDDLTAEVLLGADLLFVDDWHLVASDTRRLLGRLARDGRVAGPRDPSPANGARVVDGELGDLVVGRHRGRRRAEDIIVVNPFGLAIEDVAFAARIFAIACERGIGTPLPV